MTHAALGTSRIECATRRLKELNPRLEVVGIPENVSEANAADLVSQADVIVDCAPLFAERFAMNRQAVLQGKPLIECAMYDMEATITTVQPGVTPCLACWCPSAPPMWKREFPVFGAVSGAVGCLGAMEAIKLIAGFGQPLFSRMLRIDLRDMTTQTVKLARNGQCGVCGLVIPAQLRHSRAGGKPETHGMHAPTPDKSGAKGRLT
jgi:molybdopterin/thiamine biosynthesis adenylyltransferase